MIEQTITQLRELKLSGMANALIAMSTPKRLAMLP